MREHFVAFIWRNRLLTNFPLQTTLGQRVDIEKVGYENHDAGPDFKESQIRINGIRWCGNVEVHVRSSDWYRHAHQNDRAYDNVILHVVYHDDKEVTREDGSVIPCIQLKNHVKPNIFETYQKMMTCQTWIPCEKFMPLDQHKLIIFIEEKGIERVMEKVEMLNSRLEQLKGDWEQLAYEIFLRGMGFGKNNDSFNLLARKIPIRALKREGRNFLVVKALFLGMTQTIEKESHELVRTWEHLQYKYNLTPLEKSSVKFLRTRPGNFPNKRLAQAATVLHHMEDLVNDILAVTCLKDLKQWWRGSKSMPSNQSLELLMINVVVPFQVLWKVVHANQSWRKESISILENALPENNRIIRLWRKLGVEPVNALQSQGLLTLYQNYCRTKRCLQCKIGVDIIKNVVEA